MWSGPVPVERHWDGPKRRWLAQYAWPVGDRTLVMWADRPEEWRPLNHSCDPNTWFAEGCGLDVVARRDIADWGAARRGGALPPL